MSTIKFIVSHQDQQLGPFDEAELRTRWENGEILGIDYLYDETKEDWVLLAERFRWAAAGQLDDTMPVRIQPPAMTEEIVITKPVPAPVSVQAAEVNLVDGLGEISLSGLPPGMVKLHLSHADLPPQEFHLDVRAAEPAEVHWTMPRTQVVGHELEVRFSVVDSNGHPCLHFEGEFTVVVTGAAEKRHDVKTIDGLGVVRLTQTKSETWSLHIEYRGPKSIKLPAKQNLEWTAGPAIRLVVDGPTEHLAGKPLKVQVKALDAFGNVARNFRGTVVLDVKAS